MSMDELGIGAGNQETQKLTSCLIFTPYKSYGHTIKISKQDALIVWWSPLERFLGWLFPPRLPSFTYEEVLRFREKGTPPPPPPNEKIKKGC